MRTLREARKAAKMPQWKLAELAGTSQPQIKRLETGERKLTREWAERLAPHLSIPAKDLMFEHDTVDLVGFVSAGAEAHLYSEAQGPFEQVPAPDGATPQTVAVEIKGESLGELFDGWLVYYDQVREPVTHDLIGRLCVVGLVDGRVLIKKIKQSRTDGLYHLLSNTENPIFDVELIWAARVKTMAPRR